MKLPSLSILIPCYNTQSTVFEVITTAYAVGKQVASSLEIIAIDDASTDKTKEILHTLQKRIPVLKIRTHTSNMGYGETIKELYTNASNIWLFSLPSDNQFDAGEIKKLIPYSNNADMILGLRAVRNDNSSRKIQSSVYNRLLSLLYGLSLRDVNTIRLMKKKVIQSVPLVSHSAFVDAELAIRMKTDGMTVIEVPITHKIRYDKGGSGGKIFKTILPTIVDMIKMRYLLITDR